MAAGSLQFAGKETEDTTTADTLAAELRKQGLGVRTLPKFTIRVAGRIRLSKPDVEITDGGVHIASAKVGETKTFDAYRTATEYKTELPLAVEMEGKQIGEVFAVTYPVKRGETYHLYILPREGRHRELAFAPESLEEAAKLIFNAISGRFDELTSRAEPTVNVATRILYYGALELADAIKNVGEEELESVFGGHDFFGSVLAARLKGAKRGEALRRGPAFLFVNQLLFYVLLSEADKITGNSEFPQLREQDVEQPDVLQREYFDKVRKKNYEPIYGIDVAHLVGGKHGKPACRGIFRAIHDIVPSLDTPDLTGQVFQTLIPLEIRKPLGAHYTNPKAAALLAGLAIDDPHMTVLDPACGSGTLLVAAYQRKRQLLGSSMSPNVHRTFVEKEITGLDAMAFSAHLAAVNLALQSPLQETDHVRIGTCDSTKKRPGDFITPTEEALPSELKQSTLLEDFKSISSKKRKVAGPVKMSEEAHVGSFALGQVDLVIMNPPFTAWDNMTPDYRNGLIRLFSDERPAYRDALYWKTSQQTFFLLLADSFLNKRGRIAAVLPLTTFTGIAFAPLLKFLLENYTVRYIIVGLGRSSFSEQTSLTECLFVADKIQPNDNNTFCLVGTLKSPETWTHLEVQSMLESSKKEILGTYEDLHIIKKFPQSALLHDKETLSGLLLRLIPRCPEALASAELIEQKSKVPFVAISTLIDKGDLKTSRWILGGGWLKNYAPEALFAYRSSNRAIRDVDRLIVREETQKFIQVVDKKGGPSINLRKDTLAAAVRRITHFPMFDVTGLTDYCVYKPSDSVQELVVRYYGATEGRRRWKRITEGGKKTIGPWETLVPKGVCHVALAGRLNLAAQGTRFICCRSTEKFFLAGYGFMVRGFKNALQEKLFCLWLNSSFSLIRLLEKASITEATWLRLEQFLFRQIRMPDHEKLSPEQQNEVERIYDEFSKTPLPPLVGQLKTQDGPRARLDEALLTLLGLPASDARQIGTGVRAGLLSAIETFRSTMVKRKATWKRGTR